jgi:hypothetical protein
LHSGAFGDLGTRRRQRVFRRPWCGFGLFKFFKVRVNFRGHVAKRSVLSFRFAGDFVDIQKSIAIRLFGRRRWKLSSASHRLVDANRLGLAGSRDRIELASLNDLLCQPKRLFAASSWTTSR